MRLALIALPLLAVALTCDAAPKKKRKSEDTTQPLERACTVRECFTEREVRDFEVIDQTTLIVYVGSQRCPFQIELSGTFCDLTFAPEIYFRSPNQFERNEDRDIFGSSIPTGRFGDLRVCSNDIGIGVEGGVFTEGPNNSQPPDRFGNRRAECQIRSVASVTDDELLQLFVDRGVVPPPPPVGGGEIEVSEQADDGAEPAAEESLGEPSARDGAGSRDAAAAE